MEMGERVGEWLVICLWLLDCCCFLLLFVFLSSSTLPWSVLLDSSNVSGTVTITIFRHFCRVLICSTNGDCCMVPAWRSYLVSLILLSRWTNIAWIQNSRFKSCPLEFWKRCSFSSISTAAVESHKLTPPFFPPLSYSEHRAVMEAAFVYGTVYQFVLTTETGVLESIG